MKKPISYLLMITILAGLCSFSASANNVEAENCKHKSTIVSKEKSPTYFRKGYTGDKVCETCGVTVKKGKNTPVLKLKKPKINVSIDGKKLKVKYYKVKDATGFQLKSYVIKDYKIKGNTVTKIKGKTITKSYNTKKTVTKSIKYSKGLSTVCKVRAFIKKNGKKAYSNWRKVEIAEGITH